ncbi:hypothetical protein [Rhizobium mongolense]|uniref:Uncharacterized protein n=1 Tax=Rhizobium mongolense TaxID=57676 RepID=A0A7W6RSI6_9HYPH|nr:hypothetical protein [Rhizobium mongolense]MBB4277829.1 hypothetical protein [Rhizobium mongolense]
MLPATMEGIDYEVEVPVRKITAGATKARTNSPTNNGVPPVPLKLEFTFDTLDLIDCDPSMMQWSM